MLRELKSDRIELQKSHKRIFKTDSELDYQYFFFLSFFSLPEISRHLMGLLKNGSFEERKCRFFISRPQSYSIEAHVPAQIMLVELLPLTKLRYSNGCMFMYLFCISHTSLQATPQQFFHPHRRSQASKSSIPLSEL